MTRKIEGNSPIERLIKPRLRVQDNRATALEATVSSLPKPTMAHERAVLELLIDRLTLLDACDELYGVIEQLRIERDDAYENASHKHQAAMAKLRADLAVAHDELRRGARGRLDRVLRVGQYLRSSIARKAARKRWDSLTPEQRTANCR